MGITKPCGCHTDETMPFLTYCPLHAKAGEMREILRRLIPLEGDHNELKDGEGICVLCEAFREARALLAGLELKESA